MRHNNIIKMLSFVDKVILIHCLFLSFLMAQDYKIITQQVSLSQSPMTSDSLILQGSLKIFIKPEAETHSHSAEVCGILHLGSILFLQL